MNKIAMQKPLKQSLTIEEAQNQITLLIQEAYLKGYSYERTSKELRELIFKAVNSLPIDSIRNDAVKSLYDYAGRVNYKLRSSFSFKVLVKSIKENTRLWEHSKFRLQVLKDGDIKAKDIGYGETVEGMPLHYWQARAYIKERVLPIMDELAKMQALDPNDISGRNSLRNLAEMEARYQNHQNNLNSLKNDGLKLVMATTHVDCSDRCYEWQGRVYSLNGTNGRTDDGREYVPIEKATDIYYTTKTGKTYKNGLLGFNCRHRLVPYISGVKPEVITKEEQEQKNDINNRQRYLERRTREQRVKAELYKSVDLEAYFEAKAKAVKLTAVYKKFCRDNSRAFYPERLQILGIGEKNGG